MNRCLAALGSALILVCVGYCAEVTNSQRGIIGIGIVDNNGRPAIGRIVPGSPAATAGLSVGQRILKIDGKSTEGATPSQTLQMLAGLEGTKVTLTLLPPGTTNGEALDVVLQRSASSTQQAAPRPEFRPTRNLKSEWFRPPTRRAGPVQWNGNKVVSRVLPYSDFISLFIRLPIAHAAALGKGVRVAVVGSEAASDATTLVANVAPEAEVILIPPTTPPDSIARSTVSVALISDPSAPGVRQFATELIRAGILTVVAADLSEQEDDIDLINELHAQGAITVGRVDRQSLAMPSIEGGQQGLPFNRNLSRLNIDLFSTAGLPGEAPSYAAAAQVAGVAALAFEKWPSMKAEEARARLLGGARQVWQMLQSEAPMRGIPFSIDPVTTRFEPLQEQGVFRFKVLDAAGALGVDTEVPWFLNMLNVPAAWKLSTGKGITAVVSDQGFHVRHPELVKRFRDSRNFGPQTFDNPEQNFHGTDMSRILAAIAPDAALVPVLCSGQGKDALAANIAKSFEYAAEIKAQVISASWASWFNSDSILLSAIRRCVDGGQTVSWFHFPISHPGLLRSTFTYAAGWDPQPRLAFADRFLTDPPGFHPVEIEAGLSGTAPQAAGIAALVRSANPRINPKQVEEIILQTATPISPQLLVPDAFAAVKAAVKQRSEGP